MFQEPAPYRPKHPIRFVTASALFDGHDASINIFRRVLQASGAEIIHLGHNRSVEEVVTAAIQEDVQGIAISSYQGGHNEYFTYMIQLLRERGAGHVQVFGGGGGVIIPQEIAAMREAGVVRIFSPEDGRRMGLQGIVNEMLKQTDYALTNGKHPSWKKLSVKDFSAVSRAITWAESFQKGSSEETAALSDVLPKRKRPPAPVVGVTGTGGAGKSSLLDEIILRHRRAFPSQSIAVLSVDPTKRKTGGALLGDRIRMNAVYAPNVFLRSLATRHSGSSLSRAIQDAIAVVQAAGFDLIFVESSGIGQADTSIVDIAGLTLYVMTSEYGAASQLEKIDMLDYADLVVINKFDRRGSEDALRDVRKQYRRNHGLFHEVNDCTLPIYGTIANHFQDSGVNTFYRVLLGKLAEKHPGSFAIEVEEAPLPDNSHFTIIPPERVRYLSEIAKTARDYRAWAEEQVEAARRYQSLKNTLSLAEKKGESGALYTLREWGKEARQALHPECLMLLEGWPDLCKRYSGDILRYQVRGREIEIPLTTTSLAGVRIPKVKVPPADSDWGTILRFLLTENVPGSFPYTAGVYPLKRTDEDPQRQFAGEGPPERTNARFHYLTEGQKAKRLSTAFDSVTLYGGDPDERPDIYGKVGEAGVSIATLDDMEKLYAGFNLCDPDTSVSMTINGPAPTILALFFNTAIDQQRDLFREKHHREPSADEAAAIRTETLRTVRGTVQADILKEDQAQNTCIFSTEFSLKLMGDIQEFFTLNNVRNYYSVSISGYHIAEAGANPITQLAFTLANGFTYVEYYLSRGMKIDDFAPNLSFFFSNGLDPEYTVLGRVARRVWALAMKRLYGANERSQMLKYHIQTSGRSLHSMEVEFNDIRTTLQAYLALADECNSLHTNAYDEAVTTPTEESVRRAMAIQLITMREFGLMKNENFWQGSYFAEWLTDQVEQAVLEEFDQLTRRGGVLGAMETQYQRGKIQEESLYYESQKQTGALPIMGVNAFLSKDAERGEYHMQVSDIVRATKEEKDGQIRNLRAFQERNKAEAAAALKRLQEAAMSGQNVFAELMETVRVASLGQITQALFEVGGQYRRGM